MTAILRIFPEAGTKAGIAALKGLERPLHGRLDLLYKLLQQISRDAQTVI
jgi:hypothetical protein